MIVNGHSNGHTNGNGHLSLDEIYQSPTKGPVTVSDLISDIAFFVWEEPSSFYSLIIGADSQARKVDGKDELDYVTAIVVYRKGRGARY